MAQHNFSSIEKFIAYLDEQGKDGDMRDVFKDGEYSVGHRDGKANACRVLADIVRNSNLTVTS